MEQYVTYKQFLNGIAETVFEEAVSKLEAIADDIIVNGMDIWIFNPSLKMEGYDFSNIENPPLSNNQKKNLFAINLVDKFLKGDWSEINNQAKLVLNDTIGKERGRNILISSSFLTLIENRKKDFVSTLSF